MRDRDVGRKSRQCAAQCARGIALDDHQRGPVGKQRRDPLGNALGQGQRVAAASAAQ